MLVGVAGQQPVAQALQEAAEQPLLGPGEQHAGVHDVRPCGPGLPAVDDHPVVAEPAQRPLEQLAAVQVVPQVGLERAGRAGQREQLPEVALVEARTARRSAAATGPAGETVIRELVRLVLDQHRRGDQRIADPVRRRSRSPACRGPRPARWWRRAMSSWCIRSKSCRCRTRVFSASAVACAHGRQTSSRQTAKSSPFSASAPVSPAGSPARLPAASPAGCPALRCLSGRPSGRLSGWPSGRLSGRVSSRPSGRLSGRVSSQPSGRLSGWGSGRRGRILVGLGCGRDVAAQAAAQGGRDGHRRRQVGQADTQPGRAVRGRADLTGRMVGKLVQPVRIGRDGPGGALHLAADGKQVVGYRDGPVPDRRGRLQLLGHLPHSRSRCLVPTCCDPPLTLAGSSLGRRARRPPAR